MIDGIHRLYEFVVHVNVQVVTHIQMQELVVSHNRMYRFHVSDTQLYELVDTGIKDKLVLNDMNESNNWKLMAWNLAILQNVLNVCVCDITCRC